MLRAGRRLLSATGDIGRKFGRDDRRQRGDMPCCNPMKIGQEVAEQSDAVIIKVSDTLHLEAVRFRMDGVAMLAGHEIGTM